MRVLFVACAETENDVLAKISVDTYLADRTADPNITENGRERVI